MAGEKTLTPTSDIKPKVTEQEEPPVSVVAERMTNQSTSNPSIQSQPVVPPKTTVATAITVKPEMGPLDMMTPGPPPNQVAPFPASFPVGIQQIPKPAIGPIPSATISPAVSIPSVTQKVAVPMPPVSQQTTQHLAFPAPRVPTPPTNPVRPPIEVPPMQPIPMQPTTLPQLAVSTYIHLWPATLLSHVYLICRCQLFRDIACGQEYWNGRSWLVCCVISLVSAF